MLRRITSLLLTQLTYTEKYIRFSDFENNIADNIDTIGAINKTFSVNRYNMKLLNEKILTQYFIRDITSAITEYNRTFIVSAVLIIFALLAIGVIITAILRSGFKPLYGAINALNLLSDGNTDVDVKVRGKMKSAKLLVQ